MNVRVKLALGVGALLLLTVPGWASAQLKTVRVTTAHREITANLPLFVGMHMKFFEEVGLRIEPSYFRGGGEVIRAITTRSADISHNAATAATLIAISRGERLKIVSGNTTSPSIVWVVPADSPIKSIKDLKGKKVGFSTPGSVTHIIIQAILKKLASICEEGQKGLKIVKDLLEFSQPGWERKLVSLQECLDRGLGQLSIKYDLSQFAFYFNVPNNHPYVHVNPVEWQDVFFNLLDNACYWTAAKASLVANGHLKVPESESPFGPKIAITTTPSEDHTKLLIRVSDNGLGIEPKEQDKLFIPFFTLKGSSEEKTGIGLWFVWTIVKAHGGSIKLEASEYGKGTTFLIELPVPKDEQKWLQSGS